MPIFRNHEIKVQRGSNSPKITQQNLSSKSNLTPSHMLDPKSHFILSMNSNNLNCA